MHANNQALDFELRRREVAKKVLEAGGDEFLLISGLLTSKKLTGSYNIRSNVLRHIRQDGIKKDTGSKK